jgi:hypothetical protein
MVDETVGVDRLRTEVVAEADVRDAYVIQPGKMPCNVTLRLSVK